MFYVIQIGVVEMEFGEVFLIYVLLKIFIELGVEQVIGIVYDGIFVFVYGLKVVVVFICEVLLNFLKWLSILRNCEVVFVVYNG